MPHPPHHRGFRFVLNHVPRAATPSRDTPQPHSDRVGDVATPSLSGTACPRPRRASVSARSPKDPSFLFAVRFWFISTRAAHLRREDGGQPRPSYARGATCSASGPPRTPASPPTHTRRTRCGRGSTRAPCHTIYLDTALTSPHKHGAPTPDSTARRRHVACGCHGHATTTCTAADKPALPAFATNGTPEWSRVRDSFIARHGLTLSRTARMPRGQASAHRRVSAAMLLALDTHGCTYDTAQGLALLPHRQ